MAQADPSGPTLTSDQADYAPGADVTLTGGGWIAGDTVNLTVDDNDGQTWHFAAAPVADQSGAFDVHFTLPDWFVAVYTAVATDSAGVRVTTTFTDSNVQVAAKAAGTQVAGVSVIWTAYRESVCSGSTTSSGTSSTSATSFVGTSGLGSSHVMSLTAPTQIVVGSELYNFHDWSGAATATTNSFCVPGSAANGVIKETANYVDSGTATKQTQSIDFPIISDATYGDAPFAISATASSHLLVSFTAISGPCSVGSSTLNAVTGASSATVTLTGSGDCDIQAAQAGDSTYYAATPVDRTFTVNPGSTTVTITCPSSLTYTGAALEPCTAVATGAGGLDQSLSVSYLNNTNAGTATASASYPGDATHAPASNSTSFGIDKASSTTAVTCPSTVTYTGSAQTPCSAAVTGAGGLATTASVSYASNTNVGTATASASYAGDANHNGSSGSATFSIGQTTSSVTVTCPPSATYDGSAQTPCTAAVAGAGGLSQSLTVSYSNNTDAGTATASASYPGDSNHSGSSNSATFEISKAASTVAVTCLASVTYDGSAQTPCSATVTGAGGLSQSLTVSYSDNTDAGTATASASYAGDANHAAGSDSKTFTISKAASSTVVTCPDSETYTGSPLTPCSVSVTGAGGLSLTPTPSYAGNTNAGEATASYSFTGDSNHEASSDSKTFTIVQAPTTTTVSCPTNVTFTGLALTPCTAGVTGANLSQSLTPTYAANTNAGSATASASYAGDTNHTGSSDSKTFTIDKASSVTTVTCPPNVTYTGSALTPCSATVTGAGNLSLTPTPSYSDNTNAGQATASYSYLGDDNHNSSSDTEHFIIDQASSSTTVSCPASATYTGSALTPCTVSVTGAGGLNLTPLTSYQNNTNVGTATASYSFTGDANHTASSDTKTFEITKASSTTTVTCTSPVTYNGSAQTPCSATVTGAGGLSQSATVSYSNNTNAGTATASASYAGDANHEASSDSATFSIQKKSLTVAADNQTMTYGDAVPTLTYQITGYVSSQSYGSTSGVSGTPSCSTTGTSASGAGTYPIVCTAGTLAASNYSFSFVDGTLTVSAKDATLGYTGSLFWSTGSATATTANVMLQGVVTPGAGGTVDLTKAPVVFELYKSTDLTMSQPTLCNATVSATGIATCSTSLGLDNWTVVMHMPSNAYFVANDSDPVVLTVYQPATDKFATGGGWVTDPSSTVSSANRHGNFGFTVRYSKNGAPTGQAVFVFRGADGYDYVIKSNSWNGGGLSFGSNTVSFSAKANVAVINPATGTTVSGLGGGNYTIRVDATDNGTGSNSPSDTYAISVYTPGGSLYHQAGTTGAQLALGGGNVTVHSTTK